MGSFKYCGRHMVSVRLLAESGITWHYLQNVKCDWDVVYGNVTYFLQVDRSLYAVEK